MQEFLITQGEKYFRTLRIILVFELYTFAIQAINFEFAMFFRKMKLEQELQRMLWRIHFSEIERPKKRTSSVVNNLCDRSRRSRYTVGPLHIPSIFFAEHHIHHANIMHDIWSICQQSVQEI